MAYYEIEQTQTGHIMGIYQGDTPEEAIQAMDADAGTGSYRVVPVEDPDLYAAGYDGNRFRTEEEAASAIEDLTEAVGGEWEVAWVPDPGIVAREVEVTAEVTARGEDTTVPDNASAVDATIYCCGREVGDVTLLPGHTGELTTWGPSLHTWADHGLMEWLATVGSDDHARRALIGKIVDAVREAAARTEAA